MNPPHARRAERGPVRMGTRLPGRLWVLCGARGGRMRCSALRRVLWLGCALGLAMGARDGRTRGGHAGTADHLLYFTFYLVGGVRQGGVGMLLSVLLWLVCVLGLG